MSVNQLPETHATESSLDQLPSFADKIHDLIVFRDEARLTDVQFREVCDAMLDQAVRSHAKIAPSLVAIRFRADLESEGISLAA
jgi:hypothetical protein